MVRTPDAEPADAAGTDRSATWIKPGTTMPRPMHMIARPATSTGVIPAGCVVATPIATAAAASAMTAEPNAISRSPMRAKQRGEDTPAKMQRLLRAR